MRGRRGLKRIEENKRRNKKEKRTEKGGGEKEEKESGKEKMKESRGEASRATPKSTLESKSNTSLLLSCSHRLL